MPHYVPSAPVASRRHRAMRRFALLVGAGAATGVRAHPLCTDYKGPTLGGAPLDFCTMLNENPDGVCCNAAQDDAVAALFAATAGINGASAECKDLYSQVLCIRCHPWSSHLTAVNWVKEGPSGGMLTQEFCANYTKACGASLAIPTDYCAGHTLKPDPDYSYPFAVPADFVPQEQLTWAFKNLPLGEVQKAMVDMRLRPDGDAWWIVSQEGKLYEMASDIDKATKWDLILDISGATSFQGETGMLSVAFSPAFDRTGHFYVTYSHETGGADHWRLSRFTLSEGGPDDTADSEIVLIEFEHPFDNHWGAWLAFKPSDYKGDGPDADSHNLYISSGDGGAHDDPNNNAQNLGTLMGKMLRIQVSTAAKLTGDRKYGIPEDNPLVGQGGGVAEEIFAWGLRNPWKCSFDMVTEDLWCGDVGQTRIEEINIITKGGNYGWGAYEGTRCNAEGPILPCTDLDKDEVTMPVIQYCHIGNEPTTDPLNTPEDACGDLMMLGESLTGGFVYRGQRFKDIFHGDYIFADFSRKVLARGRYNSKTEAWDVAIIMDLSLGGYQISSFAEDADGELYALAYSAGGIGGIYKVPCGLLCDDYTNLNRAEPPSPAPGGDGTGGDDDGENGGSNGGKEDDGFDNAGLVVGVCVSLAGLGAAALGVFMYRRRRTQNPAATKGLPKTKSMMALLSKKGRNSSTAAADPAAPDAAVVEGEM